MTVSELIAILQTHEQTAVVVSTDGLELRTSDVQTVQLAKFEGNSWGGLSHGANEWKVDDDGQVSGVQIG